MSSTIETTIGQDANAASDTTLAYRTCPLCEAGCGLEITVHHDDDAPGGLRIGRIRGDQDDVASKGFICPKGSQLGHLHDDPNRVRTPLVKRDGEFVPVSWDEAFATIEARLMPIIAEHGRDACGIYLGNPGAHSLGPMLTSSFLIRAMGTSNRFSASTVDQRPKELSAAMMFGSVAVPVPDLNRTDYLLMLGANPHASNGSLCTAPDFPGRLDRIQARGGKIVVVDPRRTETAERADAHLAILPGGDALFLAAIAQHLLTTVEQPAELAGRLAEHCEGLDELVELLAPFTPDAVAARCGIDADTIVRIANELIAAPTAAVYGRMGTCTQQFGTTASVLVDIVNLLTGNLDSVGGAMFAKGAVGQPSTKGRPGVGKGVKIGRRTSRVSGQPETFGEFPVAVLAEEIETPGEGQIKGMVVVAGNPVSSCPNVDRLDAAFGSLEFMVSVDIYINETSRHADVILPAPSPLQKSHYDVALLNFAVHNVANYSPPILPLDDDQLTEAEINLRLISIFSGNGAHADIAELDEAGAKMMLSSAVGDPHGPVHERDADQLWTQVSDREGAERLLDIMLRLGPYGDAFGARTDGLNLATLEANPHGVDLGPLEPNRIPALLRTPSGKIELTHPLFVDDLPRLRNYLDQSGPDVDPQSNRFVLIGRRHVKSNNSWMHNMRILMKGKDRCTMQIHPDDAAAIGLDDGAPAVVTSRVGTLEVPAELTDRVRRGVISIPHGFGQAMPGVDLDVATAQPGVNTNVLTDDAFFDVVSGNIALNGVPVTVTPKQ